MVFSLALLAEKRVVSVAELSHTTQEANAKPLREKAPMFLSNVLVARSLW